MTKLNFDFRNKLDAMLDGDRLNYCYQCGACVGDCPAAKYSEEFNPRVILLKALFGMEDELIADDSPIWLCTNCYTCFERCPQDVRPIEVIIALKNITVDQEKNPVEISKIVESVRKTGRTVTYTPLVDKRRQELGLGKIEPISDAVKEIEIITKGL
ncbi:hypothetical protein DRQ09_03065 [candidate division KSB1 bacterium]|nr:MAG: hypothetical protein DRQ09_03065 [candidate division KSB1 bacterium]